MNRAASLNKRLFFGLPALWAFGALALFFMATPAVGQNEGESPEPKVGEHRVTESSLLTVWEGESLEPKVGEHLTVTPGRAEFGDVQADTVKEVEVKVTNTSDKPVIIKNIRPSCPCVAGEIQPNRLEPGATGILSLSWDSKGQTNGKQTKRVWIFEEGRNKPFVLDVFANVFGGVEPGQGLNPAPPQPVNPLPTLNVDPPSLDMGYLRPEEKETRFVTITNTGEEPLRLGGISSSCKCTVGELEKKDLAPGESVKMSVELKANKNPGPQSQTLTIRVPNAQPVKYSVQAIVSYAVNAEPTFINMLQGNKGQISLQALDEAPFHVISVDGEAPVFLDGDQGGAAAFHTIAWDKTNVPLEDLTHWLLVQTDHPEMPLLEFRVIHLSLYPVGPPEPWALSDDRFMLGWMTPGEPIHKTLDLVKYKAEDISKFETSNDAFTVAIVGKEKTPKGDLRLKIAITPTGKGLTSTGVAKALLHVGTPSPDGGEPFETKLYLFGVVGEGHEG